MIWGSLCPLLYRSVRDMLAHADLPELSPPFALTARVQGQGGSGSVQTDDSQVRISENWELKMGLDSHGRPSRKHGFREASEKCRRGKLRVCHCERCCTKTKTDDSQN